LSAITSEEVARVFREEATRATAALIGRFRSIDLAEEAVQHAFVIALSRWPDWRQIVALYDQLLSLSPTPVVALNRAIAVAELEGPASALELLEPLGLGDYALYHAARANLLERCGRREEAAAAYQAAGERTENARERRFLAEQRRRLSGDAARDELT
jgi:predicted RNA polymerase sigma factor